jgi:hypothetical protein
MKTRFSPPKVDLRIKESDGTRRLRGRIGLKREFHSEGKEGDNAVDNFLNSTTQQFVKVYMI